MLDKILTVLWDNKDMLVGINDKKTFMIFCKTIIRGNTLWQDTYQQKKNVNI